MCLPLPCTQLDKRLEVVTAALARTLSTNQARSASSKPKSGRYQPYSNTNSHTIDKNACSVRPNSAQRRAKVGNGN